MTDEIAFFDCLLQKKERFRRERTEKLWFGRDIMKGPPALFDALFVNHNDYLGLSANPEIIAAQIEALHRFGNGQMMSGVFHADRCPANEVERRLAQCVGSDEVLLTQSGWKANVGLIQSLAEKTRTVYVDLVSHMSTWEGARSSGAATVSFAHNSPESFERKAKRQGPGLVCLESIYSADGSVCPLVEFVEMAEKYGCTLIVDESHSLGLFGEKGGGLVHSLGLSDRVHFRTASLSKAFCTRAGMIACPSGFRKYLAYSSFPAIFSSALLPHDIAGLAKALDIIEAAVSPRAELAKNAAHLRSRLSDIGLNIGESQSQIISFECGIESNCIPVRDFMALNGVVGAIFCPPATARNRCLYRLSINALLSKADLDRIAYVSRCLLSSLGQSIPELCKDGRPPLALGVL
jgi:CAI-1 autoinducer synthase